MVLDLATPGVEDGGEVKLKLIVFALSPGDVMQGGGAAFEQEVIDDLDLGPNLPFVVEVVAKEGAQGADRLIDGGPGQVAFGLQVEQKIKDLTALEAGEMLPRIMVGELPDPAEVGLDGALAEPFELDEAGVLLIPLLRSDDVVLPICFFS